MRELQFRGKVESGEARMETQVAIAPITEPRLYHVHISCSLAKGTAQDRGNTVGGWRRFGSCGEA